VPHSVGRVRPSDLGAATVGSPQGKARRGLVLAALVAVQTSCVLRHRLDNGLTVLFAPDDSRSVVALQAWVHAGAADEPRDLAGVAHVFEHMLFKGTARRGVGQIAKDVEAAGGEINAWTTFDHTVYHLVLIKSMLATGIDVLADALQDSTFDAAELERERDVILEEIKQSNDDPARQVTQALFSTAYTRHPYRKPVIGTVESVQALTRPGLLEFFRTWYVANNIALVVAGGFEPAPTLAAIARAFGHLRSAPLPVRRRREPRQTAPRAAVVTQEAAEAHLALGFHIDGLRGPGAPALDVLSVVLGQGESARLQRQLRREQGVVTRVYAYAHALRDVGLFVISATMAPGDVAAAVASAVEQAFLLGREAVSQAELAKARRVVQADAIYQRETAQGLARRFGHFELAAGQAEFEAEYLDRVDAVTAEQLQTAATAALRLDNMTLAVLVPPGNGVRTRPGRARRGQELLARAARAAARTVGTTGRAPPGASRKHGIVKEVLPNGLRVVVKRDPSVPIVAVRALWTGGVRREGPRESGINHLLAALLTRGCGSRTADALAAEVDELAGLLAGFSGRNSFGLRAEWLARDWEAGLELMVSCLLHPTFPHAEYLRERRRVLDELAAKQASPSDVVFRLFAETLYRTHPYRRDVLGEPSVVAAITRKQIADYYRRHYPIGDLTLAIVGDVDPAAVLRRVHATLGRVKRRRRVESAVPAEDPGERSGPREVYRFLDREQAHIVVGFPGATVHDSDRYALEVLVTILSGQGGRLFVELRDRQSLAYRIGAFSIEGIDPGYVAVYTACTPDKLGAVHSGIRRELRRLIDEPVGAAELERAIRYLIGAHEIASQRRSAVAAGLAFHEAYGLGVDEFTEYARRIEAVTATDVQRVARDYLDWDAAVIATVKPPELSPGAAERARGVKKRYKRDRRASRAK
jgi:zinc protease